MIILKEKKDCVGCSACEQVCPKHCIAMRKDEEGFLYPSVDRGLCVDCHLCEKVCPVLNDLNINMSKPIAIGGYNKNEEIRRQSSSGGFFTLLAEYVINHRGVVFGARWNENWEVVHDYTESIDGIAAFRGSKYVQSRMGKQFSRVKDFLKKGRLVLFSGTPCQIKGLKLFLRKDYPLLITIDFVCHGVPSPMIWSEYLDSLPCVREDITDIYFRDKSHGWREFRFLILGGDFIEDNRYTDNIYMKGFLRNLYLRPSCYFCPSKKGRSDADATMADFWKIWDIKPSLYDDKGTTLLLLHSQKIVKIYQKLNFFAQEFNYQDASSANPCYFKSVALLPNRARFFTFWNKNRNLTKAVHKALNPLSLQVILFIKRTLRGMLSLIGNIKR